MSDYDRGRGYVDEEWGQPDREPGRRRPAWPWLVVLAIVTAVGAAVLIGTAGDDAGGGPVAAAPAVESLEQLAATMAEQGLGCEDFTRDTTAVVMEPDPTNDRGTCTVDGSKVTLVSMETAAHQEQYHALGEGLGCSMGEAFGITEINYVSGNLWAIELEDSLDVELAERLADGLDAEAISIEC